MNKSNNIYIYSAIIIIVVAFVSFGIIALKNGLQQTTNSQNKPPMESTPSTTLTCTNNSPDGTPAITSLSTATGTIGTKIEISGCNLAGFEGDKNIWFENSKGEKGILYGENGSTETLIKTSLTSPLCQTDNSYSGLPCKKQLSLVPGVYKIYATPWAKMSNQVVFTVK